MYENFSIGTDSPHQPEPSPNSSRKGEKLFKVVAVSFGLLCVLQVSLNISFRLGFFTKSISECGHNNNLTEEQEHHFQQGWVQICSSFYYISTEMKSWQESRNDCLYREADLMIIDNQAEQRFVKALFREVWIGLTDAENEGVWKWVDGTLLKETSFWCPGEPNNYKNEDCVEVNFNHIGFWNDNDCNQNRTWICEKKVAL
ncbi:CD209 antigen-like protein C isoform X2 [Gouania willdenowi]|uniref:CD209 antigen-like protein C isoform X2 n=1 Tax=Gouania willdenowi TaxID=441366 RepID=UPI00105569D9|nr:CD209 antigen-like protein C isoform X2 [Gouania willdenowi]